MRNISSRELVELVATLGVVLSLAFVGYEIRQNTISARASAFQEIGIATSELWNDIAHDRELSDILYQANSDLGEYQKLSPSDQALARAYTVAALRMYEVVYLQVEQGLLDAAALNALGYGDQFESSNLLRSIWPDVRRLVTPSFADYLESNNQQLRAE